MIPNILFIKVLILDTYHLASTCTSWLFACHLNILDSFTSSQTLPHTFLNIPISPVFDCHPILTVKVFSNPISVIHDFRGQGIYIDEYMCFASSHQFWGKNDNTWTWKITYFFPSPITSQYCATIFGGESFSCRCN
jgi:hypothetical protein